MRVSKEEKNYCKKDVQHLRKVFEVQALNKTCVQYPSLYSPLSYKKFKKNLFFYAPDARITETKENIRIEVPYMGKTIVVENRKEVIKGNALDVQMDLIRLMIKENPHDLQMGLIKMAINMKYGRLDSVL